MSTKLAVRVNGFFLLAIIVLSLLGCTGTTELVTIERTHEAMGTVLTMTVTGHSEKEAEAALDEVFEEIQRINRLMSNWNADSELSRINANAFEQNIDVDSEIFGLIEHALEYSLKTNGMYDITAGPLIRQWGFFSDNASDLPDKTVIQELLEQTGYTKLVVDRAARTISFSVEGMEIDLGSIAKGYAVDRAMAILEDRGITSALVNLGGNIGTLNLPPRKSSWVIGIRDPRRQHGLLGSFSITEEFEGWCLASSGNYERYFTIDGVRYGHIINPLSGYPFEGTLGTTIFSKSAETADVLSTATFVITEEEALELIKQTDQTFGLIVNGCEEEGYYLLISEEIAPYFVLHGDADDLEVRTF